MYYPLCFCLVFFPPFNSCSWHFLIYPSHCSESFSQYSVIISQWSYSFIALKSLLLSYMPAISQNFLSTWESRISNQMFYDFGAREFENSVGKLIESPILHSSKVHLCLKIRTPVDLTQAAVIGTRPGLRKPAVSAAPVHQAAYESHIVITPLHQLTFFHQHASWFLPP